MLPYFTSQLTLNTFFINKDMVVGDKKG